MSHFLTFVLLFSAILTMEYAASLGMENSMIDIVDLDDPDSNGGYLTPKAAEMNRSTTPLR